MPRIVFYKIGNTVVMDKSGGAQSGMKRKKILRGSSYQMSDREEENAVLPGGKSFIEPEQCSEETVSADRSSEKDVQTSLGADALCDPADKAKRAKRLVIIVGASSGIGYETALRLIGPVTSLPARCGGMTVPFSRAAARCGWMDPRRDVPHGCARPIRGRKTVTAAMAR